MDRSVRDLYAGFSPASKRLAMLSAVADPEEVQWVPWNPSLEGYLRKRTTYTTYTHTRATHFSFTVAITHDLPCVNSYQEFDARCPTRTLYYQKYMATIETMSEARERIKAKVLFTL